MATIKAIESRSVHQIQSGQVIVDLNSVAKELVENSLDAGATSIDIRFKNFGLDSIEVQDNGKGLAPEDFATVALKHHTSKLSSYEDLASLETFGFRGEALSSLCALSNFHIVTARVEDGAVGTKLDFEPSGKLKGTAVQASPKGTTVVVGNLFYNLPVRRKELDKNIKREYAKVLSLLYAYACIGVGVRFSVTNQVPKGKKSSVFSTNCNTSTKENIANVFGAKTFLALVKLSLDLEMQPSSGPSTQTARNLAAQTSDHSKNVHIEGHISKPAFGDGRQAPDRQLFFVNSRPCNLPQIAKVFNEVYKSFNMSQSPFIFANLIMDTNAYDVNVSPDKRTILLHDQAALLECLKSALTELFETTEHTVPQSQLQNRKLPSFKPFYRLSAEESRSTGDEEELQQEGSRAGLENGNFEPKMAHSMPQQFTSSLVAHWAERNTESRQALQSLEKHNSSSPARRRISLNREEVDVTTRENNVGDAISSPVGETVSPSPSANGTLETDDPDVPNNSHPSKQYDQHRQRVQQFNEMMEGGKAPDPKIPTLGVKSQKAVPGPVQSAFERMRPKRTPQQLAEITVGGTTITTEIGTTPSHKRRRIHTPEDLQAFSKFTSSPLVARGLRIFAAPESILPSDDTDCGTNSLLPPHQDESFATQSVQESADDASEDEQATDAISEAGSGLSLDESPTSQGSAEENNDDKDADYSDEHEKKLREDEKVAKLIQDAELETARSTDKNIRRASQMMKNGATRKDSTLQLAVSIATSVASINDQAQRLWHTSQDNHPLNTQDHGDRQRAIKDNIDDANAEARLSLTVNKTDFERMQIIGQFNLGFVLALRLASSMTEDDELFIIDQHAADEKFNYERLQRTTILQSQRLVHPKQLELTAVEQNVVLNNSLALKANGFEVAAANESQSYSLLTLPVSGNKTFDVSDLEELLHLLSESSSSAEIPRPRKVQRMLAMRACRSSIMVGRTLTHRQMARVVRNMGEMEKPWNCPHGRPTMRHLASLRAWRGWEEGQYMGDDDSGGLERESGPRSSQTTDWKTWLLGKR